MTKKTFEQVIAEEGFLVYTNVGDSMYPLIRPRDLLVIKKVEKPLRRLDIPLYKRDNGQYVLHRIIKKRRNDYLICGDNRTDIEKGITDKHVIGVLTAVIRGGETISVYRFDKRLYAHLLMVSFPFRKFIGFCKRVLRYVKRSLSNDK